MPSWLDLRFRTTETVERKAYYRPDIDGLRGVAVILVILYHLFPKDFENGFLGVDVFFVISGFVVTQALERNLKQGFFTGLKTFYAHRIKRILPALYVNILGAITLTCLLVPPSELQSIFKTAASAVVGVSNLALLYARFDYFSPDLSLNPFVHTWSLGAEEQFYLVFPSLLVLGSYLRSRSSAVKLVHLLIAVAISSLIYWVFLTHTSPVSAFYNPLARFWEFLAGALVYTNKDIVASWVNLIGDSTRISLQIVGCALLVLAIIPGALPGVFANILVTLSSTMAIVAGLSDRSRLSKILTFGVLVWIGKLSYSLYLWHWTIIALMNWNADPARPLDAMLALVLTFGISVLSYKYIELPFRYASSQGGKVIVVGSAVGAFSLLFVYALFVLPPSRIYLGNTDAYGRLWPPATVPLTKSLKSSRRDCHLEYRDQLSPDLFDKCSTESKNGNWIYLLGNSHAQHLVPMLEAVRVSRGYGYSAVTISSCLLVSAYQVIGSINYRYDLCKDYIDHSLNFVARKAKSGDIVLFGARSLLEKPSISKMTQPSSIYLGGRELNNIEAYEKSIADIAAFSKLMQTRGVSLIFVGPTPVFSLYAAQCAPEWFRTEKSNCKVALKSVFAENEDYFAAVSDVRARTKNSFLWDPLPSLCDKTYCYQVKDNKLMFRDRHHFSFYGSEALAPSFVGFIDGLGRTPSQGNQ